MMARLLQYFKNYYFLLLMNKSCARHTFRDHTMKKLFIFSVMALLFCGFTITANAQRVGGVNKPKPQQAKGSNATQQTNLDQQPNHNQQSQASGYITRKLNEYEECIQDIITLSNEDKMGNSNEINYYMSKAYDLKRVLNNLLKEMTPDQKNRFTKLNTRLDRFKSRGKRK